MSKPHTSTPVRPSCPASRAILQLFSMTKTVELRDGSWPGADVVDVLIQWFPTVGIDPALSSDAAGSASFSGRHATRAVTVYFTGVDEDDALSGLPYDCYESAWDCARVNDGHNIYAVTAILEESSIELVAKLDDEDSWGRPSEVTS